MVGTYYNNPINQAATAKGDLIVGNGAGTFTTVSAGASGKVLIANGAGTLPSYSSDLIVATDGEVTMPKQPAFLAYRSAALANQTGDGTTVTYVPFNTEVFDQNGDYNNGTFIFTAPVTGKYHFDVSIQISNLDAAHTLLAVILTTTARGYVITHINPFAISSTGQVLVNGSCLADMSANDTAYVSLTVTGGTKTVTIQGSAPNCFFCGSLIC